MIEIIPTHVPRDALDLADAARAISTYTDKIHIDIVDGTFAPNLTWPFTEAGKYSAFDFWKIGALSVDVHLMVTQPQAIGIAFAQAGGKRILGHLEAFTGASDARNALNEWRKAGALEVGLGLLLQTPLDYIGSVISECDVVHLMTIASIGTQGIAYDEHAAARVEQFHRMYPGKVISVDGGIGESNIATLVRAGATRFGIGSAISRAPDPEVAFKRLKELAESALQ